MEGCVAMGVIFSGINENQLKSAELKKLVSKVKVLTDDGYERLNKNYELFIGPYMKILRLSKQEKEWHLYFYAIYQIISLNARHDKYDEVVKYAEMYYKECDLYMDRELPNYPGTNMSYLNTWIYDRIFEAYYQYYQIDDAKMDDFMKKYEESALKYGKTYLYYEGEMELCTLYRDTDRVEMAARNFRRYEKDMFSCYVCGHRPYIAYLLLTDQNRQAEEFMTDLVHKNIPKQHLWCYKYCEEAIPDAMYESILFMCVKCGKEESFRYFFEKYWKKVPYENQWESDADAFRRLLCALSGYFHEYKDDLRRAEKNLREEKHETTVGNIEFALAWWCYFTLLDRSGVHEVEISLPGINIPDMKAKENGQDAGGEENEEGTKGASMVPALTVAAYMEKRADEFGALFSKARARFDYEGLKDTYRNCFLTEK